VDRHRRRDVAAALTTTIRMAIVVVWLEPIFAAHRLLLCLALQMQIQIASSSVSSGSFSQSLVSSNRGSLAFVDYLHHTS
jgi:hypothetical protein